ncbi:MAG: hypothetical protein V4714_20865 [Bacteroidota bacterium]
MRHAPDQFSDTWDGPSQETSGLGSASNMLVLFEANPQFKRYASDLLDMLGLESFEEILEPIERAKRTCQTMGIPENQHFKQIYRFNSLSMSLRPDYKLTPLATYLITVNANPANINVAKAQVYFFLKNTRE